MRVIVPAVIILIVLLVVCAFLAYAAIQAKKNDKVVRPDRKEPWAVELEDRNTTTEAWLTKGEFREYFGSVERLQDGYADKLIDLEVAAEDRARERNTARKVIGR